jgi:MOSC domain-containing protein YiiM
MIPTVRTLHLHPPKAGEPLLSSPEFTAVEGKGIAENKRYFGRVNYGKPSKRQVTLIECEVIREHAAALGLDDFAPGEVRSNIETEGIDLIALLGRDVQVGEAVLHFIEPRTPCSKMDALAPGLKDLMENNRQGVIATVVRGGKIRPGDAIRAIEPEPPAPPV